MHEPSIEYSFGRVPFAAGGLRCWPHGGPQNLVRVRVRVRHRFRVRDRVRLRLMVRVS